MSPSVTDVTVPAVTATTNRKMRSGTIFKVREREETELQEVRTHIAGIVGPGVSTESE